MASASDKFPGNKWRMGNLGAAWPRRNTASAFRRLGAGANETVTIARDEFFGSEPPPLGGAITQPVNHRTRNIPTMAGFSDRPRIWN